MGIDFILFPTLDARSPDMVPASSFFFDPGVTRNHLAAAAAGGFGAVVIDDASGPLANLDIAANVVRWSSSLDIVLTHWVGVTSPQIAASDFAALDRQADGRLALRIVADDADAQGFLKSWQRTDEFLTLLKRLWSNERPIDHEGSFYSLKGAQVPDKGPQAYAMPVRMSGCAGKAVEVAARHATVFELPLCSIGEATTVIGRVRTAAAGYGRADRITFAGRIDARDSRPASAAATVTGFLSAGITQFMICGLDDAAAIERFGAEIIRPAISGARRGTAWRPARTPTAQGINPARPAR